MGFQRSTSVRGFIGGLPRLRQKKIWQVFDANGVLVQCVSATDNRESTAQRYIDNKYPGQTMILKFEGYRGFLPPA